MAKTRKAGKTSSGKTMRSKKMGVKSKPTRALTTVIKRVLNRQLETKYVAQQIPAFAVQGQIQPTLDYLSILPKVAQQTAAGATNVREGDRIEPVRAKVSGHLWYDNLDVVVGNVIFVKLFFVTPKNVKSLNTVTSISEGLLEDGTADPVQWTAAGQDLQAFYPVCKENYTLLKTKTFKFVKNGGLTIGNQPTHSTNIGKDRYSFSYSWKPPVLKYDEDADTTPTNHLPLMFAVAYSPGYNYTTDASLVNQIKMNYCVEMSFKDA